MGLGNELEPITLIQEKDEVLKVINILLSDAQISIKEREDCRKVWNVIHAKPRFLEETYRSKAINAIEEIRALWLYVGIAAYCIYSDVYSHLSFPLKEEVKLTCEEHREAFAIYDPKRKIWLIEPNEQFYNYCFNGVNFEDFRKAKETSNKLLLLGKYTILMQEDKLLKETNTANEYYGRFVMPDMVLIEGVPGCGKTRCIIKEHNPGSLVLTSGTESAEDIRTRMAQLKGSKPCKFRNSYRTIDSYLINSRRQYHEVWVDEALMEHPGKLFLVCLFSRCKSMFILGDPHQLGYINRVKDIMLLYEQSSMFFNPAATLDVSYRCPVDVIAILSDKYYGRAYSASNILRSLYCKTFTSLKDVPKSEDVKYLVFKQAEKKRMKREGYNVSTIHEFQGKEAAHVMLVRMSRNLGEVLYESPEHILVGLSRHRHSFVYYTPVTDDLKKLIDVELTDAKLRLHLSSSKTIGDPKKATVPSKTVYHPQTNPLTSKSSPYSQSTSCLPSSSNSYLTTAKYSLPNSSYYSQSTTYSNDNSSYYTPKSTYSPSYDSYYSQSYSYSDSYYPPRTTYTYSSRNNPWAKPEDKSSILKPIITIALGLTFLYVLKRMFSAK